MKKKITVLTLCAMLLALCSSAHAQQPKKVPRIGYLEDVGAVYCNTAYGREDKAFQGEPDIINRTLCVSTVVTACPNVALRSDSERYNKSFRNNGDISACIHFAPNAGTFIRGHRIYDGYICDGSRRI